MTERKFLQETNFQEEHDEDIIPERRAKDQIWRSGAANDSSQTNNNKEKSAKDRWTQRNPYDEMSM